MLSKNSSSGGDGGKSCGCPGQSPGCDFLLVLCCASLSFHPLPPVPSVCVLAVLRGAGVLHAAPRWMDLAFHRGSGSQDLFFGLVRDCKEREVTLLNRFPSSQSSFAPISGPSLQLGTCQMSLLWPQGVGRLEGPARTQAKKCFSYFQIQLVWCGRAAGELGAPTTAVQP